jgi:hypothetical protein
MILSKDYIELDDFLPVEEQEKLKQLFTHPSFPWSLSLSSVYGKTTSPEKLDAVGFFHNMMYAGEKKSEDLPAVWPILRYFEEATRDRFRITAMNRVRAGLFTMHPNASPHGAHTDATFEHWTAVYYVNDSDGDFILYNETFDDYTEDQIVDADLTIKRKVKPKQGRIVAFNGKHYHCSSYPTQHPLRIAITFNFKIDPIV